MIIKVLQIIEILEIKKISYENFDQKYAKQEHPIRTGQREHGNR